MKAKDYIINVIKTALAKLPYYDSEKIAVNIEQPKSEEHGDYSTNVAMQLPAFAKKAPKMIAEDILNSVEYDQSIIEKIAIAGPGFINFTISNNYYQNQLKEIINKKDEFGHTSQSDSTKPKVLIEFVSANPTGPLNVVSARAATVGDVLVNLFRAAGYDTIREYYINDAGRQVNLLGKSVSARYMALYQKDEEFPDEGYHGEYIIDIAKDIANTEGDTFVNMPVDERADKLAQIALEKIINANKQLMIKFGVDFDIWFHESELRRSQSHLDILELFKKKNLSYEQDGATWFKSKQYGDEKDRVLVTGEGEPTYFLIDIAYHKNKFDRGFEILYNLWGPDHHGYIGRMKGAIEAMGYVPCNFNVEIIQQVNLLQGGEVIKMSKRAGKIIEMKEVIDEVGVDVARYFFINRKMSSHLDFDLDLAKKQSDENPVYYLQYAYARIRSVIRYAEEQNIYFNGNLEVDLTLLTQKEEINLIKKLVQYPDIIQTAVKLFEPHMLPNYLHNLAAVFHHFYHHHRVVSDDKQLTLARLYLVKAVEIVLKNGFGILGISAPEKM